MHRGPASRACFSHTAAALDVGGYFRDEPVRTPAYTKSPSKSRRSRDPVPAYHLTPSLRDDAGDIIWPAPANKIANARQFIRDWSEILLFPDIIGF